MSWLKKIFYSGSSVSSSTSPLMDTDWRTTNWTERTEMKDYVRDLKVSNREVKKLHILVHGPTGAGKSSFINSIDSIFQDRMTCGAIADAMSFESFTTMYQTHKIKDGEYGTYLPFVISDTMGIEEGYSEGAHPEELVNILKGYKKDGYVFSANSSAEGGSCEELDDKIHCLVSVLPANNLSMMPLEVIKKMRDIRMKASELRIPQVALLTRVDETCPEVKKDLKLIYRSKKIRLKMQECSNRLGVPMNCIFPVKNYHEQNQLNDEVDVLLLSALTFILNFANDHVAEMTKD